MINKIKKAIQKPKPDDVDTFWARMEAEYVEFRKK
jgi:hypothetical protein